MTRETHPPPHPPHGPVTFRELTADLLWPRLLRAVALAFRPACLALAFLLMASIMAVGESFDALHALVANPEDPLFGELVLAIGIGAPEVAIERAWKSPFAALLLLLALLPFWCVFGLASCRILTTDAGLSLRLTGAEGLGFALPRIWSALGAFLIPLILAAALLLLARLIGLLGDIPVVDVVGAVLHVFVLALTAGAVLLLAALLLGGSLLLPAIAAESADAFDAIQRAYAYVLGRTARFALYAAIGVALLWITAYIIQILGVIALETADSLAPGASEESPSHGVANAIRNVWLSAFSALLAAIVVSVYFSLSATLFLLCRRVNDEQDVSDVWMPTDIPAARAEK